jgi:hypothetical protein
MSFFRSQLGLFAVLNRPFFWRQGGQLKDECGVNWAGMFT